MHASSWPRALYDVGEYKHLRPRCSYTQPFPLPRTTTIQ